MTQQKNEEKLYDLRTLDHYLTRGKVKKSDHEKYLKSLPDEEGNFELVSIEEETEE